jgi:hypothetical protein
MRTHALAAVALALTLVGIATASAATITKEEATGVQSASVDVADVRVQRNRYSRIRVAAYGTATVSAWTRVGFSGEKTATGQSTLAVAVTGTVSIACVTKPNVYWYSPDTSKRWTYRQRAGLTTGIAYRLPSTSNASRCEVTLSATADGPSSTTVDLPYPEYPIGSETGTSTTETTVRVVVTSLR